MKKAAIISILIMLLYQQGYAQASAGYKAWQLTSYSGNVGLRGFYREQIRTIGDLIDYSKIPYLAGNIALYTKSFIGHPNLLLLDIGGEYNPGSFNQTYTVSPDRSEVLTLAKLDLRGTLFSTKPMNLTGYLNLGRNLINREYVSSSRTDSKLWGIRYNYFNNFLPVTISYNDRAWSQFEIETDRLFYNEQKDFEVRVKRSFTKYGDVNDAVFQYNNYFRRDANNTEVRNIFKTFQMTNTFYLDEKKRYMLRSFIFNLDQTGTINQSRFQVRETASFKLPLQFRINGSYELFNVRQQTQGYLQHWVNLNLEHQLFQSLRTSVYYDNQVNDHTAFDETNLRMGFSINYLKKIPTGTFRLNYSYRRHHQNVIGDQNQAIQIIDEQHTLIDGEIVLLDRPSVILGTVIVKDATGAIIYQEGFDYLLVERNDFVEILRIPGGQIANNSPILVDYSATQVGSFNFVSNLHAINARLIVLNNRLEFFYAISNQDYADVEFDQIINLNYFDRYTYGVRVNIWLLSAGIERDEYNSTIIPHDKMKYFLRMNGKLGKKLLLSLNSEVIDQVITETRIPQLYANVFGKMVYMMKPRTKLDFDIGYRKQVGDQIDLDMITAKLEFNTVYRNLYMRLGLEVYKRMVITEELNFKGIYFQIDRKF